MTADDHSAQTERLATFVLKMNFPEGGTSLSAFFSANRRDYYSDAALTEIDADRLKSARHSRHSSTDRHLVGHRGPRRTGGPDWYRSAFLASQFASALIEVSLSYPGVKRCWYFGNPLGAVCAGPRLCGGRADGVAIPMVLRLVGVEFLMTAPLAVATSAGE
jgi:hypothetical protein